MDGGGSIRIAWWQLHGRRILRYQRGAGKEGTDSIRHHSPAERELFVPCMHLLLGRTTSPTYVAGQSRCGCGCQVP